jgi:hypothetical protein
MADGHAATFSIHGESRDEGYKAYSHIEAMIVAGAVIRTASTAGKRGRVKNQIIKMGRFLAVWGGLYFASTQKGAGLRRNRKLCRR